MTTIIVGGGVIGSGIAYELTRRGVDVTLIDRGPIGREASWASAGIISLPGRPDWREERIALNVRSLERYPALVTELEARTGIGIEYRRPGELAIAVDEAHADATRAVVAWQRERGYTVDELTPAAARELEPAVPPALAAAWLTRGIGALSVYRLTLALAAAAEQAGALVLAETPVAAVTHAEGRVTGVRLADRDLPADTVILATGAWTRFFGDALGAALPTKPIKGQLIAFAGAPVRPTHLFSGHGGYVRPRLDGTTMVAATQEDVGFDRRVTGDGIAWLLDLTRTLCPGLLEGEMVDSWTGLRPASETDDPIIGPVPAYDGLWVAAGHFRTGAKEAPATAELVADAIVNDQVDPLLVPFAPGALTLPS